jgi:RNA polymerase sigma-70 factor (ECF subfamily)
VARQLLASVAGAGPTVRPATVNGDPGVVVSVGGVVAAVIALGIRHGRIDHIHGVGNPAKLAHLQG